MKRDDWNIIAKKQLGEDLSEEEKTLLKDAAFQAEIENELQEGKDTLHTIDTYFQLKKYDTSEAWSKVADQMTPIRTIPFRRRFIQVAAIFLILIASGVTAWKLSKSADQMKVVTAMNDLSQPEVTLPDGTHVILSRGSKLKYPKTFNEANRVVELEGEAFFDVTPDKQHPFIIQTKEVMVRVLGTSFNVNAYNENEQVEVFVKTGKVELKEGDPNDLLAEKVVLIPGEKGIYSKSERRLIKEVSANDNSLAWFTHDIEFKYTELSEVIATLEHTYGIEIECTEGVDLSEPLNATFTKQNKDFIMEIVAYTLNLELEKKDEFTYFLQK